MNELFGPFASFCKVDETSVGAGWNACRRGHGKQAQTEDAAFKRVKKTIAESSLASLGDAWLGKVSCSRMRSKGSRVTLGVWVLRVYSIDVSQPFATVRNRLQLFATFCNCSQPFASGRASGQFCKSGYFWRFQSLRSFVSHGRRGFS